MDVYCLLIVAGLERVWLDACRLRMRNQADRIVAVNFGSGANNAVQFGNKRAELHFKFMMWLQRQVRMPNDKLLQEECADLQMGQRWLPPRRTGAAVHDTQGKDTDGNRPVT